MSTYQFPSPNYTEVEVWNLLSEYLEKKFDADSSTIQRGIYVELYKDGSVFLIKNNEDEVGRLYCYRNMRFNISGDIIFNQNGDLSEHFSLNSICDYLGKPFPKPIQGDLGLSEDEMDTKHKNLAIIEQTKEAQIARNIASRLLKTAAIQVIHAFEYWRAKELPDEIFHIEQTLRHADQLTYIQQKHINCSLHWWAIHPKEPTLDEICSYIRNNVDCDAVYSFSCEVLIEYISNDLFKSYKSHFSVASRGVGSILIPLHNTLGALKSALVANNIPDTKKGYGWDQASLQYVAIDCVYAVRGFVKSKPEDIVVVTEDLAAADTLQSVMGDVLVLACLLPENTESCLNGLIAQDKQVIVVADNGHAGITENKADQSEGFAHLIQHLMNNIEQMEKIGLLFLNPVNHSNLDKIYRNANDLAGAESRPILHSIIATELQALFERKNSQSTSEIKYALDTRSLVKDFILQNYNVAVDEVLEKRDNNHQAERLALNEQNAIALKAMAHHIGDDPVLAQERKQDVMKWLEAAQPISTSTEDSALQNKMAAFFVSAPPEKGDEYLKILQDRSDGDN